MDKIESYRVVIVDDEYLVRELIKRSIPWQEINLDIVGEATGAMEAMDVIEETNPDILITDICMPIIDGIKLSSMVLNQYPQIKVVVLTGHDEFHYAKESISLGIKEYMLKPINPPELKSCMIKLVKQIKEERILENNLQIMAPYLKEKVLNDLVSFRPEIDIVENLKRNEIFFSSEEYQVALCNVISTGDSIYKDRMSVFNIIHNHFVGDTDIYCFLGSRGYIVLLSHNSSIDLELLSQRIINNVINRLDLTLSIGIGESVYNLMDIYTSYNQASKGLEYQVVEGINSVILFNDIKSVTGYDSIKQGLLINELAFSIKTGIIDRLENSINELFELQIRGIGGDINSIRVMASNILSTVLSLISEEGLEVKDIFVIEKQPYENIFKLVDLKDIKLYLFNLSESIIRIIKDKNSKRNSLLISKVKNFLKDNLDNCELQLAGTAEIFNVNSSYLSRKFKQECGESFIEYLAKLRLQKAIILLKNSDKRSYEIADEIGISDPHYFSIFFKKKMNMSISEYKKTLKVK